MEETTQVLVEHWRGVVTKRGSRLVCTTHKPVFSIAGAWLLAAIGIATSLGMTALVVWILIREGFEPLMLVAPLMGLPFLAVATLQLRALQRRWGSVEMDARAKTIVWRQGTRVRGTWSVNDICRLRSQHALLVTYRFLLLPELWLVADLRSGDTLTLLLGNQEERRIVQDALESFLPVLHR